MSEAMKLENGLSAHNVHSVQGLSQRMITITVVILVTNRINVLNVPSVQGTGVTYFNTS